MKLILTCEHAGNQIPQEFQTFFKGSEELLRSHRGYDPGAFDLFQSLEPMSNFSSYTTVSRLLVEPNRSLHHPQIFSSVTKRFTRGTKKEILEQYYFPYRNSVENEIGGLLAEGEQVLHISVHSFTPILNGEVRNCDVGLLFDPARNREKEFCKHWRHKLERAELYVRFNYPYKGKADGFTSYLRKKFPDKYLGIELEMNQKFVSKNLMDSGIKNTIFRTLSEMIK